MPEQLAVHQAGREPAAVHLDHGMPRPPARLVHRAREQLLAGPGLSDEQHRRVGGRDLGDERQHFLERAAVPYDPGEPRLLADRLVEVAVLLGQLIPQPLDLAVGPRPPDDGRGLEGEDLQISDLLGADLALRGHEEDAGEIFPDEEGKQGCAAEPFLRGPGCRLLGLGELDVSLRHESDQLQQIVLADRRAVAGQPGRECIVQRQGMQLLEHG